MHREELIQGLWLTQQDALIAWIYEEDGGCKYSYTITSK